MQREYNSPGGSTILQSRSMVEQGIERSNDAYFPMHITNLIIKRRRFGRWVLLTSKTRDGRLKVIRSQRFVQKLPNMATSQYKINERTRSNPTKQPKEKPL